MARTALLVGLWCTISVAACQEAEEAPAATPTSEHAGPSLSAADEEEEEEELELLEGPASPLPLDEMDRPALEAACFEGRQDACDRLGH